MTQYLSAQFDEVSKSQGINHFSNTALLMGGGILSFDYNNDGNEDLYLTGAGNRDVLYHNTGDGFVDISYHSNVMSLTTGIYTSGVISGDVNKDGCEDVFITTFDDSPNKLFLGNCEGVFNDVSLDWNLNDDIARSSGAVFIDYDNDGFLDLYVINYVKNSHNLVDNNGSVVGFDHECYTNFLYKNRSGLTFDKIQLNMNDGCGLAVTGSDYDNDGNIEVFVINDFGEWVEPNKVYSFDEEMIEDVANSVGLDIELYGMGITSGDVNGDSYLDYYVTNLGSNSLLIYNKDSLSYVDKAQEMGVDNTYAFDDVFATGWGANFLDFDNDTDLDLFVANGYVSAAAFLKNAEKDPNIFFIYEDGLFSEATTNLGLYCDWINRSSIQTDFNNDGLIDLVVSTLDFSTNSNKHTLVYKNESASNNSFVKVNLKGVISNPNAFGSRVEIWINGQKQIRDIISGGSHASQNSQIAHFGCGNATVLDSMKISWPSGKKHFFENLDVNRTYSIIEDKETLFIAGCMDSMDRNYDSEATMNYGCKSFIKVGCMNPESANYDEDATFDSGDCLEQIITSSKNTDKQLFWFDQENSTLEFQDDMNNPLGKLLIISLDGRKVLDENINEEKIKLDDLEAGLYVAMRFIQNSSIQKLKFVKK